MFSKISRYRKLPDIEIKDVRGEIRQSKVLRLLPEVTGIFFHTVEGADRLDHLAYKYYDQPKRWWRICDANPEFMLPSALLGKDTVVTYRFTLTYGNEGEQPVWAGLLKIISETIGVEDVKLEENIEYIHKKQNIFGRLSDICLEKFTYSVVVTFNRMNINPERLMDIIVNSGFKKDRYERIGRIGKKIVIPPNTLG